MLEAERRRARRDDGIVFQKGTARQLVASVFSGVVAGDVPGTPRAGPMNPQDYSMYVIGAPPPLGSQLDPVIGAAVCLESAQAAIECLPEGLSGGAARPDGHAQGAAERRPAGVSQRLKSTSRPRPPHRYRCGGSRCGAVGQAAAAAGPRSANSAAPVRPMAAATTKGRAGLTPHNNPPTSAAGAMVRLRVR